MDEPSVITYAYRYPMESPTPELIELRGNAEAVLGYSTSEWHADPYLWQRVLHPEDAQDAIAATWRTTFQQVDYDLTYRMVTRDSRIVWIRDEARSSAWRVGPRSGAVHGRSSTIPPSPEESRRSRSRRIGGREPKTSRKSASRTRRWA